MSFVKAASPTATHMYVIKAFGNEHTVTDDPFRCARAEDHEAIQGQFPLQLPEFTVLLQVVVVCTLYSSMLPAGCTVG